MLENLPCVELYIDEYNSVTSSLCGAQTKRRDRTELNHAVASLGVRGFSTSSRRSRTVSSKIQILNRSSVASLGVRGLATGSQNVVHL